MNNITTDKVCQSKKVLLNNADKRVSPDLKGFNFRGVITGQVFTRLFFDKPRFLES